LFYFLLLTAPDAPRESLRRLSTPRQTAACAVLRVNPREPSEDRIRRQTLRSLATSAWSIFSSPARSLRRAAGLTASRNCPSSAPDRGLNSRVDGVRKTVQPRQFLERRHAPHRKQRSPTAPLENTGRHCNMLASTFTLLPPGEQPAYADRMPVLGTKLHLPSPRRRLVQRARLTDQLRADGCEGPRLVLVAAPAGFGKTTLLAQWLAVAEKSQRRVAWLALDPGDGDLRLFLTHLVAAIQAAAPEAGVDALALLEAGGTTPTDAVLVSLINDLDVLAGPMVVALDDYHVIDGAAVHDPERRPDLPAGAGARGHAPPRSRTSTRQGRHHRLTR
jgi:hypothetical protein